MDEQALTREALGRFVETKRADFEGWLRELLEIPSVSADPALAGDVRRTAEAAVALLRGRGASAEIVETGGHPMVYGRFAGDPTWPTVTVYNHLDVQPADGDAWMSDPFVMTTRGDRYYARGATDDKGPALTALLGALAARAAEVPVTIAFLWELEEEIGSPNFLPTLQRDPRRFTTDSVVVSDTIWITRGKPSSPAGLRGLQPFRLTLQTAENDLHSGLVGGAARNPLTELMQVVAACVDARSGEVLIPGFYEDVEPLDDAEAQDFLRSGFSVETFLRDHHIRSLRATEPLEVMRRIWAAPTFEVHGVVGGYTGPGVKTVIPPQAEVKISCRLVPNMTCAGTMAKIRDFIGSRFPDVEIHEDHGLEPFRSPTTGPYADAIRDAYQFAFDAQPVFTREGGSIGAVPSMATTLNAQVVFLGLSLPEHGYHAPNEFFDWEQASGGATAFARYFARLA